jgi:hypothetical protein
MCWIREQIVEDLPSGLVLQFELLEGGGARLTLAGKALAGGNREILFDAEGRVLHTRRSAHAFRRPSWLH